MDRAADRGVASVLPTRALLQLMLESLLHVLADPSEEVIANTPGSQDILEETAEALIFQCSTSTVDQGLTSAEIAEALTTARDAELMVMAGDLGLNQSLETELVQAIQWIQEDLEALQP